jgi:adenylate cyclase
MRAFSGVFDRFDDPEVETRYRLEQRSRQAGFTRTMALIGIALFSWYAVINPVFISREDTVRVAIAQFSMVPAMLAYAWYVGRPGYLSNGWVDLALFVAIQPSTLAWVDAFSSTGVSGWPFYAELAFDLWLELAFACLAFAAIPHTFALLSALAAVYYPSLLLIRGYDFPIVFYSSSFFVSFAFILAYLSWYIDKRARTLFALRHELDQERQVSQRLLDSALPRPVSDRLRTGESIADR